MRRHGPCSRDTTLRVSLARAAPAGRTQIDLLSCSQMCEKFWTLSDTVGKNKTKIQEYIRHQLEEDKLGVQLSLPYPAARLRAASSRNADARFAMRLLGRCW